MVNKRLYNIVKDPGEKNDVADKHPEVVADLLKSYDQWWLEVRPLMVNEDAPLDVPKSFDTQYKKQKETTGIPEWVAPKL